MTLAWLSGITVVWERVISDLMVVYVPWLDFASSSVSPWKSDFVCDWLH